MAIDLRAALDVALVAAREAGAPSARRPSPPRRAARPRRQGRGRHGGGVADPPPPSRGLPGLGVPRRGDGRGPGNAGRPGLAGGPERRHPRLPEGPAGQRGLDRPAARRGAASRRRVRLRVSRRRGGSLRLGRGLRAVGAQRAKRSRPLSRPCSPRGTSSSCRAPGSATRRATSRASRPRASGPCPASRTASRWWRRERPRPPSRSTGPRPGTTPAGHALLRGAGATLLDEQGREVAYAADGRSRCVCAFGGREGVGRVLRSRPWHTLGMNAPDREGEDFPVRLRKGRAEGDSGRLARAQGCLLGQVAGDNLGALVEFADRGGDPEEPPGRPAPARGRRASGTSWPASRPTTPRWRSPWRGRSWPGRASSARRRSRRTAPGCARRPSTWAGRSAPPCATARTRRARPTAR